MISHNPSISADNSEPAGPIPMDETCDPYNTPPTTDGVQVPDPNHQIGSNDSFTTNDNNVGSRETLLPWALPDRMEPDDELAKQISKGINYKASSTVDEKAAEFELLSVDEEVHAESSSQPKPNPQPDHSDNYEAGHVQDNAVVVGLNVAFEIKPSPKRSVKYDEATILTNEFMKKCIDDASGLSRKRKGICSLLDAWKLNNAHKKGKFLFDPLITGMCDNLCQLFEGGYVSKKPHLMNDTGEANMENSSPINTVDCSGNNSTNSPDNRPLSPRPTDKNTTVITTDVGSKPCQVQTSEGTGGEGYEDTPYPSQSHQDFEYGGSQPDTLEGLSFIEDDRGTSIGSRGTSNVDYSCGQSRPLPETGSLLERTRAVAQYIKEKSSAATPSTSGSVSMKRSLVGKTRTVCSRLFFETLVLKSCDLVDVKQDEPYGDITLIVTPKLSKLQFSS